MPGNNDEIAAANHLIVPEGYGNVRAEIVRLLQAARSVSVRSVNALMTARIGRLAVASSNPSRAVTTGPSTGKS